METTFKFDYSPRNTQIMEIDLHTGEQLGIYESGLTYQEACEILEEHGDIEHIDGRAIQLVLAYM